MCGDGHSLLVHQYRSGSFKPSGLVYEARPLQSGFGRPAHSAVHWVVGQALVFGGLGQEPGVSAVFHGLESCDLLHFVDRG